MVVMSAEIQVYLPESRSLKDKRQVLNSLKGRIRSRFEVAVAEVDHHDLWQRGSLGLAAVSTAVSHAEKVLNEVVRFIEQDMRVQVLDFYIEQC